MDDEAIRNSLRDLVRPVGFWLVASDPKKVLRIRFAWSGRVFEWRMSGTLDGRSPFNPRAFFSSLFAISLLTLSCGPQLLLAQTGKASVSGRVTDQNNAALPNAQVQIRNTETKTVTSVKTNGEGLYVISSLNPGNYIMNVNKQGFRPVSVTGVTLNVQQNLSRNFVLRRDRHLRSGHRNSQNAELPLNKRSFSQGLTVTSGVTPINTSPSQGVGVNDLDNLGVSTASVAQPAIQGQWNRSNLY